MLLLDGRLLAWSALITLTTACTSRATSKPRPSNIDNSGATEPESAPRPNITFPIFSCPPTYAAWYCLNDATCFAVEIHNEILYNCECALGFMGPRCEYKEIDGSYLPTRQRVMLEQASIVSGATLALLLMVICCMILYIRHEKHMKIKLNENGGEDVGEMMTTAATAHINAGMDEVDCRNVARVSPVLRPFGAHHYVIKPLAYAYRHEN